jgi:hypothetical protein
MSASFYVPCHHFKESHNHLLLGFSNNVKPNCPALTLSLKLQSFLIAVKVMTENISTAYKTLHAPSYNLSIVSHISLALPWLAPNHLMDLSTS